MEKTLGKMIGVVEHSLSITNDKGEKATIGIKIDFSNASDAEIKSWLSANRGIAGQRPWRSLTKAEIMEMNGRTFDAVTIGTKPKTATDILGHFAGRSKADIMAELMRSGMSEAKAELMADALSK